MSEFKEVNRLRNGIKGMVNSRQFPVCEKELKKSLEPGVVGHTFNPQHWEGRDCQSMRLAWGRDPVSGQPSLCSERQKAGEDVTEQGGHDPVPVSSTT